MDLVDTGSLFSSAFDHLSVIVPQIDLPLTSDQLHNLHQTYNPLQPSDQGGMNIYVDVREFIANILMSSVV